MESRQPEQGNGPDDLGVGLDEDVQPRPASIMLPGALKFRRNFGAWTESNNLVDLAGLIL